MDQPRSVLLGVLSLGTAVLISACGEAAPSSSPWVVRDSAGVKIVTTPAATLAAAPAWSLDPAPLLDLGTVDEGGPTDFYGVVDVRFLPGDRLVVANQGSEELRFFSLAGEHLHTAGQRGNGPREFKGLAMVRPRADSLVTYDGGNDRFSVRGPWGEYARSFRLEWFSGLISPEDILDGDRILTVTGRSMVELEGSGIVVDTALISVYDMEGRLVDSVARLPHNARFVSWSGDMKTTLSAPFIPWGSVAAADGGFCFTFGPAVEVRCYALDGTLRRIARVDQAPRTVTSADIDAFWADAEDHSTREEYKRYLARFRESMPFPDLASAFDRILTDDRGRMWVRRYAPYGDEPVPWWIFRDGGVVATLAVPRGVRIFDVWDGRVSAVWRDDFDVEHVRLYRLDEGLPGG
jgi:hypothetical protein